MFENHVPGEVDGPGAEGRPQRRRASTSGCSRARRPRRRSAWPPPSAGRARSGASTPAAFTELRPGCFDVHERVRDMNANGVLASMNFPTMAGFNARTFTEARRQGARRSSCSRPTTTGHIDEWCAAYPGRFIPLGIVPMWDIDLAVAEVQRIAQEGLPVDQLPRGARTSQGCPSFLSGPLGPDAPGARATRTWCCRCTSAPASTLIQLAARGARSTTSSCSPARSRCSPRRTCCSARRCAQFPDLKVALSEGGIGWIPFYLDRVDRHFQNQAWLDSDDFGGKLPSDVFREHILACFITDPSGPEAARPDRHRHHRLGVRLPPHRHHVAGVARVRLEGVPGRRAAPTTRSTRSPGRTPAASSTGTRSQHTPEGAGDGRRAAGPGHRRRHHPHAARRVAKAQRGRRHRRLLKPACRQRQSRAPLISSAPRRRAARA